LQAYAGPDGQGGLEILCLNKDRHVIDGVLSAGQLRAGASTIGDRDWTGFGDDRTILDLGAGIAEEVGVATLAARVAPYNADGDNLLVRHLYVDDGWRRVRHLHCEAVPAITAYGDGYMAACSTGAHHVALVGSSDGRLRVHRVATPVAIRSGVGAVTFKDGFSQLSVVGRGGRLWLLDVGQGRWWSQGRATHAPVRISRWNT